MINVYHTFQNGPYILEISEEYCTRDSFRRVFVDVSVAGGIVIVVAHVHNFMQSVFKIMQATCYPHFCGTAVKFNNKRRYDALK